MARYYFDVRDGDDIARDEIGVDLPDVHAMVEAKTSLADIAREVMRDGFSTGSIAIDVRSEQDVVGSASLSFEARIKPLL